MTRAAIYKYSAVSFVLLTLLAILPNISSAASTIQSTCNFTLVSVGNGVQCGSYEAVLVNISSSNTGKVLVYYNGVNTNTITNFSGNHKGGMGYFSELTILNVSGKQLGVLVLDASPTSKTAYMQLSTFLTTFATTVTTSTVTTTTGTTVFTTVLTTVPPTTVETTIPFTTVLTTIPPTTIDTTTIPPSCSGTPNLIIGPNPAPASDAVFAGVTGLSGCNGYTITIKDYQGCTSGATIATFTSNSTGGGVSLEDPSANGQYGYYACVNGLSSSKYVLTVAPFTGTTVSTTSTTTVSTTTIPASSCSGTPSLALNPNPASPSGTVNANVSGLTNCGGYTITIKDYQGCTSGSTIASMISDSTTGSISFQAPTANGQYGYFACINGISSVKGILTVN